MDGIFSQIEAIVGEAAGEREGQEAVGNRPAKGGFLGCAFGVDVDPLFIVGCPGEIVDHLLIDGDPVGHANFGSDQGLVVGDGGLQG